VAESVILNKYRQRGTISYLNVGNLHHRDGWKEVKSLLLVYFPSNDLSVIVEYKIQYFVYNNLMLILTVMSIHQPVQMLLERQALDQMDTWMRTII
jgi:hypothetical protein